MSRYVSRGLTVLYPNVDSFLSKLSWLLRVHFCPSCQTYIGSILCAVNPYYVIEGLYERSVMATYRGKHIGELPPHVFAIANECYYSMWKKGESQCVLIRYGQYLIVIAINLIAPFPLGWTCPRKIVYQIMRLPLSLCFPVTALILHVGAYS